MISPARRQPERNIRRCWACGAWVYGQQPCPACDAEPTKNFYDNDNDNKGKSA